MALRLQLMLRSDPRTELIVEYDEKDKKFLITNMSPGQLLHEYHTRIKASERQERRYTELAQLTYPAVAFMYKEFYEAGGVIKRSTGKRLAVLLESLTLTVLEDNYESGKIGINSEIAIYDPKISDSIPIWKDYISGIRIIAPKSSLV